MDCLQIERLPTGVFVVTDIPTHPDRRGVLLFACPKIDEALGFIREKFAPPDAPAVKPGFKIGETVNFKTSAVGTNPGRVIGFAYDDTAVKVRWSSGLTGVHPCERLRHGA